MEFPCAFPSAKSKHARIKSGSRKAGKLYLLGKDVAGCRGWIYLYKMTLQMRFPADQTCEYVNIIMARDRPMQTAHGGRTARRESGYLLCVRVWVCRCAAVRLMSNTFALESTAT